MSFGCFLRIVGTAAFLLGAGAAVGAALWMHGCFWTAGLGSGVLGLGGFVLAFIFRDEVA